MTHRVYYIKPEAAIVCKICKQSRNVSAPELTMTLDEVRNITASDILEAITERQKIDGWHHDYCPRYTTNNAARIAEEELDEQI